MARNDVDALSRLDLGETTRPRMLSRARRPVIVGDRFESSEEE